MISLFLSSVLEVVFCPGLCVCLLSRSCTTLCFVLLSYLRLLTITRFLQDTLTRILLVLFPDPIDSRLWESRSFFILLQFGGGSVIAPIAAKKVARFSSNDFVVRLSFGLSWLFFLPPMNSVIPFFVVFRTMIGDNPGVKVYSFCLAHAFLLFRDSLVFSLFMSVFLSWSNLLPFLYAPLLSIFFASRFFRAFLLHEYFFFILRFCCFLYLFPFLSEQRSFLPFHLLDTRGSPP